MTHRSTVVNLSNYHDRHQFLSDPTTGISSGNNLLQLNWRSEFKYIDVILQQMIPEISITLYVDNRVIRTPLVYGASNAFLGCFWVDCRPNDYYIDHHLLRSNIIHRSGEDCTVFDDT